MFNEHTLEEYEAQSKQVIEQLLSRKTGQLNTQVRQAIIDAINEYGDPIDWSGYTTRQILEEVRRSDIEAGEYDTGILAGIYAELV